MTYKIIQWNCRGCIHNYCHIKLILQEHDPICMAIQETHLRPNQPYSLKNYSMIRREAEGGERAHGGVALFLRDDVIFDDLQIRSNLQVVAARVKVPVNITLCNVYLPDANWTLENLNSIVDQLEHPFILMGDFNAHNTMWGSIKVDTRGRLLERWLENEELVLLNTGCKTNFNTKSNIFSAIDLTIATCRLLIKVSWKTEDELYNSDHFPIVVELDGPKMNDSVPIRWNTRKADWTKFSENLRTPSDSTVEKVTESIIAAATSSIPKSGGRPGKKLVPWFNEEVKNAIKVKKRAFNRYRKLSTIENLIVFKKARASARKIILKNKRNTWNTYTSTITRDEPISTVWRKVRGMSGYNPPNVINAVETEPGHIEDDQTNIAEVMANYFEMVSKTTNYDPKFLQINNQKKITLDFDTQIALDYNLPFTLFELEESLAKSKDSAPGPDTISNDMLKNLTPEMKNTLLNMYNQLWENNTYPDSWKEATVIPILKPNKSKLLPSSYRPISLTCCMGKILEKMINKRLQTFLDNNNLLVKQQAGYRRMRSTVDHLVLLEHNIQEAFRKREHLVAVFFDIKGAFDMTWRQGILDKLFGFGMRGRLPLMVKSFLSNRSFKLRNGGNYSSVRTLENGVPQGSTLSCTLFAIAINDICKGIDENMQYCLYVDDLALFSSGKTVGDTGRRLQTAVNQIVRNGDEIGYVFSKEKTKCVHFCRLRKPHYDPLLYLGNSFIECMNVVKFLGLMFDCKLTWEEHLTATVNKCKKALNILKALASTKWGADPKSLLNIYKAMVLSKIDYGCAAYSSARRSQLMKLDKIQCMGIRYCLGSFPTTPLQSLYCESAMMPLEHRRKILINAYLTGVKTNIKNPNSAFLFTNHDGYSSRPTITRPLAVRYSEYLIRINVDFPRNIVETETQNEMNDGTVKRSKFNNSIKEKIIAEWQDNWNATTTLLRQIEPAVKDKYTFMNLPRSDIVRALRLRSGHTDITHRHHLRAEPAPVCSRCDVELSVLHIIENCPVFDAQRNMHGLSGLTVVECLKQERIVNTLNFLRSIDLYAKI